MQAFGLRAAPDPLPEGRPAWETILRAGPPRAVLARLIDGDPLELERRCEARLRNQAVLMEMSRLLLRTCAHVARDASLYTGQPALDVWLSERIRRSLRELLEADRQLLREASTWEAPTDPWLLAIAAPLGIDPALMARGCAAFNGAPHEVRRALFGIVLDGRAPADWARENATTPERALAALRRALWLLGLRDELDVSDLLEGGRDEP